MQAIIYMFDLKNKPKRHTFIYQGAKSNPINKYSESVVTLINILMEQKGKENFLNECITKYKAFRNKK